MTSSRHARLPSLSPFLPPSLYFILCHTTKRLSIYLSLLPRAPISLSIFLSLLPSRHSLSLSLSFLFIRFLSLFHSYWQASCMHKSLPLFRSITLPNFNAQWMLSSARITRRLRDFLNEQHLYYIFFFLFRFCLSFFPARHRKFLSSGGQDDLSSRPPLSPLRAHYPITLELR